MQSPLGNNNSINTYGAPGRTVQTAGSWQGAAQEGKGDLKVVWVTKKQDKASGLF